MATTSYAYTIEEIKKNANLIQKTFERLGNPVKRGHALEASSVIAGYKDYNTAKAAIEKTQSNRFEDSNYTIHPLEKTLLKKNQIADIIIIQDIGNGHLEFSPCIIEKDSVIDKALRVKNYFTTTDNIRLVKINEIKEAIAAQTIALWDENEPTERTLDSILRETAMKNNHSVFLHPFGLHSLVDYYPIYRAEQEQEDPAEYGSLEGGDFFADPKEAIEFVKYFKNKIGKEIPIKTLTEEREVYFQSQLEENSSFKKGEDR